MTESSTNRILLIPVDDTEVCTQPLCYYHLAAKAEWRPILQENERALEWALENIHKQGQHFICWPQNRYKNVNITSDSLVPL